MTLQQFSHRLRSLQRSIKKPLLTTCLLVLVLVSLVLPPAAVPAQAAPAAVPAQAVPAAAQAEAVVVLPPTFSVQRGFYSSPFQVTLSTATPGAIIRYTTDGATPALPLVRSTVGRLISRRPQHCAPSPIQPPTAQSPSPTPTSSQSGA